MSPAPQRLDFMFGLRLLAVSALVFASCIYTLGLTRATGSLPPIWIANGIIVGCLLRSPLQRWPHYLLAGAVGYLVARSLLGDSWLLSLGLTAINSLEVLIVSMAIHRRFAWISSTTPFLELGRVALVSTLGACAVSGLYAAFILHALTPVDFWALLQNWYRAHVLGMVIVATLTLVTLTEGTHLLGLPGRRWKFVRTMGFVAAATAAVLYQPNPALLFLAYPPLLWAVFRHRFAGLVLSIALVALITSIATALSIGPFAQGLSSATHALLAQVFIGVACLISVPVALALAQGGRFQAQVRENEQRLRTITDNVPAVIAHIDANERYTFVNAGIEHIAGRDPSSMIGKSLREVTGEAVYADIQQHIASVLRGEPVNFDYETELDGEPHYFRSNFVPDRSAEGHIRGFYALTTDVTHIKLVEQELSRLARVDTLTGLANRRHFNERIAHAVARASTVHGFLLVMIIDVDRFKTINDTFGHGVGDEVLKEVGQRIHGCLRKDDLIARIGGDEFVVLVEGVEGIAVAEMLARKVTAAMQTEMTINNLRFVTDVSIGVGLSAAATTVEELMQMADKALYVAKAEGGRGFHLAASAM